MSRCSETVADTNQMSILYSERNTVIFRVSSVNGKDLGLPLGTVLDNVKAVNGLKGKY